MVMTLRAQIEPLESVLEKNSEPFITIHRCLDQIIIPQGINEPFLEALLVCLQKTDPPHDAIYWLTLARLAEAAILCAGHYADNCEFQAVGDLLVNPRKIRVQVQGQGRSFIKKRHGRLTDQLAQRFSGAHAPANAPIDPRDAHCDVLAPALLPDLYRRLATSGFFTEEYLDHLQERLTAIADTIAFLSAWQVDANEELHRRLQLVGPAQKAFIQEHLCRFDAQWFWLLGQRVRMIKTPRPAMDRRWGGGTPQQDREALLSLAVRN